MAAACVQGGFSDYPSYNRHLRYEVQINSIQTQFHPGEITLQCIVSYDSLKSHWFMMF